MLKPNFTFFFLLHLFFSKGGKGFINKLETIMENLNCNVGEKDMKGLRSFLISDGIFFTTSDFL